MSLILDALSRAEREKRAHDGVPDILAPVEAPRGGRRIPSMLVIAAAVIAVVLGALAYWQWPGPDSVQTPPSAGVGHTGVSASSTDAADDAVPAAVAVVRRVAPLPTPKSTQAPEDSERIAALYSTRASGAEDGGAIRENAAPQAAEAESASRQTAPLPADTRAEAAAEIPASASARGSATRSETPVDLEQVLREVRRASANDSLSDHPVPVLESLSQQFRDRVPTLMYLRHDYSGDRGSSSVLINGESLRVGQRTRSVQVVEILPDSVILRYDGQDFRLRALNSWVNL